MTAKICVGGGIPPKPSIIIGLIWWANPIWVFGCKLNEIRETPTEIK